MRDAPQRAAHTPRRAYFQPAALLRKIQKTRMPVIRDGRDYTAHNVCQIVRAAARRRMSGECVCDICRRNMHIATAMR